MALSSDQRGKKIIDRLQHGSASIQELADALSVSNMTVHRDLNRLVAAGLIEKSHGCASLISDQPESSDVNSCSMCGKPIPERTSFIVRLPNGKIRRACCAHCGLMLQMQAKRFSSSMTTDFLRARVISANFAFYVIQSELTLCCMPGILTFGAREDAEKFVRGFGGKVVDMNGAMQYLHETAHAGMHGMKSKHMRGENLP